MGDELTQALSRFIGMEYDKKFLETIERLKVELELYDRYVDDQDLVGWSIGRRTKFCPEAGVMVDKSEEEIEAEKDKKEDKIFMAELRKIADSIITMLNAEEEFPSKHPELNFKVPILDMAVWVEDKQMAAPGMESQNIHSRFAEGECLPIGQTNPETQGLDIHNKPATRLVPQISYQFYAKPSLPKTTIMCSQQTHCNRRGRHLPRRLITIKEHCCDKKTKCFE